MLIKIAFREEVYLAKPTRGQFIPFYPSLAGNAVSTIRLITRIIVFWRYLGIKDLSYLSAKLWNHKCTSSENNFISVTQIWKFLLSYPQAYRVDPFLHFCLYFCKLASKCVHVFMAANPKLWAHYEPHFTWTGSRVYENFSIKKVFPQGRTRLDRGWGVFAYPAGRVRPRARIPSLSFLQPVCHFSCVFKVFKIFQRVFKDCSIQRSIYQDDICCKLW